jgi:HD-GYP domain-containing protein (c-di-GMP phosphodiesterase class II)
VVIAHAYEELSADRSYRRALDGPEARAEFERGAGTQFDAAVVAAFHAGPIRYGQGPDWGGHGRDTPTS